MRAFMTVDGNAAEGMLCLAIHVLRASCELSKGKEVVMATSLSCNCLQELCRQKA